MKLQSEEITLIITQPNSNPDKMDSLTETNLATAQEIQSSPECRKVTFTTVETRTYSAALGDHPDSRDKLPISLGWEYSSESSTNIDEYEENRRTERATRRSRKVRRIPFSEKRQILLNHGYSDGDIELAMRLVALEKSRRRRTKASLKFYKDTISRINSQMESPPRKRQAQMMTSSPISTTYVSCC